MPRNDFAGIEERLLMRLLALLVALATIGLATPAHAEPLPVEGDDAGFLAALQQASISYASPEAAVGAGRTVCHCLNRGESGLELIHDLKMRNPEFDMDRAANFALISAKYYCPHHLSEA
jgi:hypothetical protein